MHGCSNAKSSDGETVKKTDESPDSCLKVTEECPKSCNFTHEEIVLHGYTGCELKAAIKIHELTHYEVKMSEAESPIREKSDHADKTKEVPGPQEMDLNTATHMGEPNLPSW